MLMLRDQKRWMQLSRIKRAQVYSSKEREFVLGARAIVAGQRDTLLWSILPKRQSSLVLSSSS